MSQPQLTCIDLKAIMANRKRVILKHGKKPYLLSITRRGKLILTATDTNPESESNSGQTP